MSEVLKNPILRFNEQLEEDDSVINDELYSYYPESGTQLNNSGNITIRVNNTDNFYLPSESSLEFEGQIQTTSGAAFGSGALITFVNYGLLHLFDLVKYTLNGTPIETVFNPGVVATMMGLATFPGDFKQGQIEGYVPDTLGGAPPTAATIVNNKGYVARKKFFFSSDPLGYFRLRIPLKRFFGFAEDYHKVLYGFGNSLVLTRSSSDDNALTRPKWADESQKAENEQPNGKVFLKQVSWRLPRVSPNEVASYELMQQIKNHVVLNCGFRMRQHQSCNVEPTVTDWTWRIGVRSSPEKPRYILLSFQTDRQDNQGRVNTVFDHCDLASAHVLLNNDRYPLNDFETDFKKNVYAGLYGNFLNFRKAYYGVDPMISGTQVDAEEYKDCFPIFAFDVSKQSERLKTGVTDITVRCRFNTAVPAKTIVHAVIISDRKLKFKSDGEKMSIIF